MDRREPPPVGQITHREDVRWALIGASNIARTYMARAIQDAAGGELVGVVSSDLDRARRLATEFAIPQVFSSLEELWAAPSVDAVYISSINSLHAPQTLAAAGAGKHVLCEKPLAPTGTEADEMVVACREAGIVLGVNHHLRCAPAHQRVRQLIVEGRLGRILSARAFHGTLLPPELRRWRTRDRMSGGAALDITVHDVDLLRFLLDDDVTEVVAFTAAHQSDTIGVEDTVAGVLRFRGGTIATFHDSLALPFARTALTLDGERGTLHVSDAMADDPIASVQLIDERGSRDIELQARDSLYVDLVSAFNASIAGRGEPAATGEDGLASVRVATAAILSATRGSAVRLAG